jgi:predicted ATPase
MTPEQYQRVGEIFHAALDVPAADRRGFLANACSDDEELQREVESLLAAHAEAGPFIERPAIEVAASLIAAAEHVELPRRIGRYEISAPIARGGMGEVYRARDESLGRDVALKFPRQLQAPGQDAIRRFELEARAASSLNHPNIITIHEIGEAEGRRFIAMELVEGRPLSALIGQPLPPGELVRIGRQLAQALAVAHAAGIVHGDIKTENVMRRSDGYVKVLDFGVARLLPGPSADGARGRSDGAAPPPRLGTPRYMSPEQARGHPHTASSDVFAAGVVMYELATGRHPFVADSAQALWRALESEQPTPPSYEGVHLPAALDRLLLRMLEKDPSARPTAAEVEAAFTSMSAIQPESWQARGNDHNLPLQRTPFVGRAAESAKLTSMLLDPGVRLLTLTGPGGTGKTRLAVEVAARLADAGVAVSFVNLATVAEARLVATAVARVQSLSDTGARPLVESLCDHLRGRGRLLLLLDNFEHVAAAAVVVQELLDSCPALTVLVTSRVVLHLYGEHEFPVAPLPLPETAADSPDGVATSAAVELFVQRARAVRPDFSLSSGNAHAVAEICRRLDGLPLAIELAAARVKILPPAELLARLDRRLELLTGGPRDLPARQQTLRQAIDWSYDLLAPAEQRLFRRMSVFVGGCTLEALEAVCDANENLGIDVLSGVTSLVDNSLLVLRSTGEDVRCQLLETIREYARDRLDESGETAETLHAYAAYALVLAEEGAAETGPAYREAWLRSCEVEHDNLRAAFAHLASAGPSEWALRLAIALFKFWEWREHLTEGRESLAAVLDSPAAGATTRARARALYYSAMLADAQRDHAAAASFVREAHGIYQRLGDINGVATALNALARQTVHVGGSHAEARSLFGQAAALWEQLGDAVAADQARSNMANIAKAEGNEPLARTLLEEVVRAAGERGDLQSVGAALNALGDVAAAFGDVDRARLCHSDSLSRFRQIGDQVGAARVLADLASLEVAGGNVGSAIELVIEALRTFDQAGHQRGVARQLEMLSWCARQQSRHAASVSLASAAGMIRRRICVPVGPVEREKVEQTLSEARGQLPGSVFERAWAAGQDMTLDALIDLARG